MLMMWKNIKDHELRNIIDHEVRNVDDHEMLDGFDFEVLIVTHENFVESPSSFRKIKIKKIKERKRKKITFFQFIYLLFLVSPWYPFLSLTGSNKLCHSKRVKIQPSHTDIPPMAGQQTGLRPQLHQQGRRGQFRTRHAHSLRNIKQ